MNDLQTTWSVHNCSLLLVARPASKQRRQNHRMKKRRDGGNEEKKGRLTCDCVPHWLQKNKPSVTSNVWLSQWGHNGIAHAPIARPNAAESRPSRNRCVDTGYTNSHNVTQSSSHTPVHHTLNHKLVLEGTFLRDCFARLSRMCRWWYGIVLFDKNSFFYLLVNERKEKRLNKSVNSV